MNRDDWKSHARALYNPAHGAALARNGSRVAQQNARREPCPRCQMLVLPEGMARHNAIHHE